MADDRCSWSARTRPERTSYRPFARAWKLQFDHAFEPYSTLAEKVSLHIVLKHGRSSVAIGERCNMELFYPECFCPITTYSKRITATLIDASSRIHSLIESLPLSDHARELRSGSNRDGVNCTYKSASPIQCPLVSKLIPCSEVIFSSSLRRLEC